MSFEFVIFSNGRIRMGFRLPLKAEFILERKNKNGYSFE